MFHLFLLVQSSTLSDILPQLQCRYSFTWFFFLILWSFQLKSAFFMGYVVLHYFLSFVPSMQFMQTFYFCKMYTNTNLPIKLCSFYVSDLKVLSMIFSFTYIEAPSLPCSISLTALSFCFVKVSFTEEWVKIKVSQNTVMH